MSMPTATEPLSLRATDRALRPELVVGLVVTMPASAMPRTMFETVAVESPVWRASSAWVCGPLVARAWTMRCSLSCRSAGCEPGLGRPLFGAGRDGTAESTDMHTHSYMQVVAVKK